MFNSLKLSSQLGCSLLLSHQDVVLLDMVNLRLSLLFPDVLLSVASRLRNVASANFDRYSFPIFAVLKDGGSEALVFVLLPPAFSYLCSLILGSVVVVEGEVVYGLEEVSGCQRLCDNYLEHKV